jgi:predicted lipoprotein with Yx(FWY)xxD motif
MGARDKRLARAHAGPATRYRGSGLSSRAGAGAAAIAGIVAIGLLAACGSSNPQSSPTHAAVRTAAPAASVTAPASARTSAPKSPAAAVVTATLKTEHSDLGTVLADGKGMTVYWFAADHGMTSACSGACAAAWPPVIGMPKAAAGVTLTGALGTITRSDGAKQATYNGHPLYTFKADTAPGQANGNMVTGFGAQWFAITIGVSGGASTTSGSGTSTGPSTGSSGSGSGGWTTSGGGTGTTSGSGTGTTSGSGSGTTSGSGSGTTSGSGTSTGSGMGGSGSGGGWTAGSGTQSGSDMGSSGSGSGMGWSNSS